MRLMKEGGIYIQTGRLVAAIPENGEWRRPETVESSTGNWSNEFGLQVVGDMVRLTDSIVKGLEIVGKMRCQEQFELNIAAVTRWCDYYRKVAPLLEVEESERETKAVEVLLRVRRAFVGLLTERERELLGVEGGGELVTREDIDWARKVVRAYS